MNSISSSEYSPSFVYVPFSKKDNSLQTMIPCYGSIGDRNYYGYFVPTIECETTCVKNDSKEESDLKEHSSSSFSASSLIPDTPLENVAKKILKAGSLPLILDYVQQREEKVPFPILGSWHTCSRRAQQYHRLREPISNATVKQVGPDFLKEFGDLMKSGPMKTPGHYVIQLYQPNKKEEHTFIYFSTVMPYELLIPSATVGGRTAEFDLDKGYKTSAELLAAVTILVDHCFEGYSYRFARIFKKADKVSQEKSSL